MHAVVWFTISQAPSVSSRGFPLIFHETVFHGPLFLLFFFCLVLVFSHASHLCDFVFLGPILFSGFLSPHLVIVE